MKHTVIGTGDVGRVAGVCFGEIAHKAICGDTDEHKVGKMRRVVLPIFEAEMEDVMRFNRAAGRIENTSDFANVYRKAEAIFIGVSAPERDDGSADLAHIATVARQIAENVESDLLVVVTSTVPVGTNDKVAHIHAFLALKVACLHDIANLCEFVGADVDDVAHGTSFDEGIGSKLLGAGVSSGDSCSPKDTKALQYRARQHSYELRATGATTEVNEDQKLVVLYRKAGRWLITIKGLKVAVLGQTSKPGNDNVRKAPSLANVALLPQRSVEVIAFDPAGRQSFEHLYPPHEGSGRSPTCRTHRAHCRAPNSRSCSRNGPRFEACLPRTSRGSCGRRWSSTAAACSHPRACDPRAWSTSQSAGGSCR